MPLHRFRAAACGAATLAVALCTLVPTSAGAASTASAPVVHESSTLLACPGKPRTTLQIEGCAEHKVIATDKTIDALNAKIFTRLSKAGRGEFVKTNADWVDYRDAACTTEASIYSGGSVQPVAYANCLVSIDGSHVTELKAMLVAISPAG
ncbi:MAG: lysozyme inhibitor LprI family protein [Solirubrobacteraceae bacterium]